MSLLALSFLAQPAQADEEVEDHEEPSEVALRLSRAKASELADAYPGTLILGCDTIVSLAGQILGKPTDAEEARAMLTRLRDRSHSVYTGLTLIGAGQESSHLVETRVTMRDYTDDELATYIASGDPLDKAGAYAIQNRDFHPVASWEGCYANVVGLPLCHIARELSAWSVISPIDVAVVCQAYTGQRCALFSQILS